MIFEKKLSETYIVPDYFSSFPSYFGACSSTNKHVHHITKASRQKEQQQENGEKASQLLRSRSDTRNSFAELR
jgi:hypothetical protein